MRDRITKTDDVLGGNARLKDHRISVLDIVEMAEAGQSASQIAEELQIDPNDVQAAFKYYRRHREAIEQQARERAEFHKRLREESRAPAA